MIKLKLALLLTAFAVVFGSAGLVFAQTPSPTPTPTPTTTVTPTPTPTVTPTGAPSTGLGGMSK